MSPLLETIAPAPGDPSTTTTVPGSLGTLEDAELLARCRTGDRAAFGELFRRHEPVVRRRARRLVRASEVDDVVADTFAAVLRALLAGRGPETDVRRYLFVTVRHAGARSARRRDREQPSDEVGDEIVDLRAEEACSGVVAEAMHQLSDRHRQVLWWREVEGWSLDDLGEELGLSANATAALAYRARRSLQVAYALALIEEGRWS